MGRKARRSYRPANPVPWLRSLSSNPAIAEGLIRAAVAAAAMKRYHIEHSDADITGHGGLALIGQAVERHTTLTGDVDTQHALRQGIKHSGVLKSYLGLLCPGKNVAGKRSFAKDPIHSTKFPRFSTPAIYY